MNLDQLRAELEQLHTELALEHYRAGAGLQAGMDTASILEGHERLVDPALVAAAAGWEAAASDPRERRRLAYLRDDLASMFAAHAGRQLNDRLETTEAEATVEWDGQAVSYRSTLPLLLNAQERDRRLALAAARMVVLDQLEPLHLQWVEHKNAVARELGYADHIARCGALGDLPLEALRDRVTQFLADTAELYEHHLHRLLRRHGFDPATAAWFDLGWVFRGGEFDAWFAADALLPTMRCFTAGLGLDLEAAGRVTLDLEDRPLKSPRAFCNIIRAPQEVILVIRPSGGLPDYAAFLHELGHALHFASMDAELPWEFRHLGDNAVTEAFAFLFDHLTWHGGWLRRFVGLTDPRPLVYSHSLRTLMMVRKYAAQFLYELELFRAPDPRALRADWAERIGAATGVAQPPANYLNSVDDECYAARYLQGWLFEAVLAERLDAEFGPEWFAQPAAGARLTALWRRGQDRPVRELFVEQGAAPLDYGPLLRRIERGLAGGSGG